jgi:hypothetical protein
MAKLRLALFTLMTFLLPCGFPGARQSALQGSGQPAKSARGETISARQLLIGGATIEVQADTGDLEVTDGEIAFWVQNAARAVTVFYGRFPVQHALVRVVPGSDSDRSIHGTTWGNLHGFQAVTRMRLGRQVTQKDLAADWTMTHELVHTALASLPEDQQWMEEGVATYIEPIARAQAGELSANQVWLGMVRGMPHGEPGLGDRGLDRTHSWGRTYWGGALFCLVADVTIRRQTHNRKGLQDALRATVADGSTIDQERSLINVLQTGDRATGTTVLVDLYEAWKDKPVTVDLDQLWSELGIRFTSDSVDFDSHASSSSLRESITSTPAKM